MSGLGATTLTSQINGDSFNTQEGFENFSKWNKLGGVGINGGESE